LIFISTDFIFDGDHGSYSENSKPNPISIYGTSKWNAEKLIRASTIDSSIVRTSLVMGYFENLMTSNLILWVREKLSKGEKISIVNDQIRTPTWSVDLAEGCFLLIKNSAAGIYNISGSEKFRISELIMQVAEHGNFDSKLIKEVKTKELNQIAPRPLISDLDISKARRNIGFNPHSFKDVLDSMPYI
jgi:dTDP-4-dehydrorhamnose reductase